MTDQSLAIPVEKRSTLLKPFLEKAIKSVVGARAKTPSWGTSNFFLMIYPWVASPSENEDETVEMKRGLIESGFDGESLKWDLSKILNEDSHLKECCLNELTLARWANEFVVQALELTQGKMPIDSDFEVFFTRFADYTYSSPFAAISFTHLFNFEAAVNYFNFGNIEILKLSQKDIAQILGETTSASFMHFEAAGSYFIRSARFGYLEDHVSWLLEEREKAEEFIRLLQYYKDGIVHINYTSNFFSPMWVNTFRKIGNFYMGDLRKNPHEMGENLYKVNKTECEDLTVWWRIYQKPEISEKFSDNKNKLGRVIEAAGTYYESSHTHFENARRLIDLSITLEALFSPYNQNEISHQLAELAAQFIGENPDEKIQIYKTVKEFYSKRSKLFHGSYDAHSDSFIATVELDNFASLMRKGLLKFITLRLRGRDNHKEIINEIRESLFDPEKSIKLKIESDISTFISENSAR